MHLIHSEISIKLLHVSAPGCYHQGVIQNKGVQGQQLPKYWSFLLNHPVYIWQFIVDVTFDVIWDRHLHVALVNSPLKPELILLFRGKKNRKLFAGNDNSTKHNKEITVIAYGIPVCKKLPCSFRLFSDTDFSWHNLRKKSLHCFTHRGNYM
jgi:hypothetical protein